MLIKYMNFIYKFMMEYSPIDNEDFYVKIWIKI